MKKGSKEWKQRESLLGRITKDLMKLEKKYGVDIVKTAMTKRVNWLRATASRRAEIERLERELIQLKKKV
jgi:hypothetical protein